MIHHDCNDRLFFIENVAGKTLKLYAFPLLSFITLIFLQLMFLAHNHWITQQPFNHPTTIGSPHNHQITQQTLDHPTTAVSTHNHWITQQSLLNHPKHIGSLHDN